MAGGKNQFPPWPNAHRDALPALWADPALRIIDIAAKLQKSEKAVRRQAAKQQLGRRPMGAGDRRWTAIRAMHERREESAVPYVKAKDELFTEQLRELGGFSALSEERFASKPTMIGGRRVVADFYRLCIPLIRPAWSAA